MNADLLSKLKAYVLSEMSLNGIHPYNTYLSDVMFELQETIDDIIFKHINYLTEDDQDGPIEYFKQSRGE